MVQLTIGNSIQKKKRLIDSIKCDMHLLSISVTTVFMGQALIFEIFASTVESKAKRKEQFEKKKKKKRRVNILKNLRNIYLQQN